MSGSPVGDRDGLGQVPPRSPSAATAVVPGRRPGTDDSVAALFAKGIAALWARGIAVEVVRARPNCLVVRSTFSDPERAGEGRRLVSDWLTSLPRTAYGTAGTVVEAASVSGGGNRCIHTLLWDSAPAPLAPPRPAPTVAPFPPAGMPTVRPAAAGPGAGSAGPSQVALPVVRPPAVPVTPQPPSGVAPPLPVPTAPRPPDIVRDPTAGGRSATGGPATGPVRTDDSVRRVGRGRAGRRWAWLRRRGWMVVVAVVAGAAGGQLASGHAATSYSATATLVVQSGASTAGPGSANDAEELAVTYAALIPEDQALVRQVADVLDTTPATVARRLNVEAEAGTSLLALHYSAPSPDAAISGADVFARLLASPSPPGHAIPAGSVAVVSPPRSAALSGSLHRYGVALGALLGLLVGCGAALAAERADRRVDDLEALGDGTGCPATAVPGGISATELAVALERATNAPLTVVPIRPSESRTAGHLANALSAVWPAPSRGPAVGVSPAFALSPESLGGSEGPTVVVVGPGERLRVVHEVSERLRLMGRDPAWAVLDLAGSKRGRRRHGD